MSGSSQKLHLDDFRPRPALVRQETIVTNPRFPVIDAHNHLAEPFGGGWDKKPLPELIDLLDQARVRVYIDLDGGWGEDVLNQHLEIFKSKAPERFVVFCGVDWDAWPDRGDYFVEWAADRLRSHAKRGAEGLKIWKNLGLQVRDQHNRLVSVDDRRLDPLWAAAGELGLPVVIHVADPVAFFDPLTPTNERWEELHAHPDWQFPSPPFPSFMSIMEELANLVTNHPQTTFIGAHVGCFSENLQWVGALLERCANFYVDISARISELGRQPYSARRFFIRYADRILFGSDMGPNLNYYRLMYRFLETDNEYFSYGLGEIPSQGRWHIHGMYLPDDVLEKIYYRNAERVILKT